ncbi:MAG: acetyl-CoA carboxylase, carboxyltransferase subunit beta [Planctomycetota bacterium]
MADRLAQLEHSPPEPVEPPTTPRSWAALREEKPSRVPEGLWLRCEACSAMLFRQQLIADLHVCGECGHHARVGGIERVRQLADENSFEPMFDTLEPADPLKFVDLKGYRERLSREQAKTGQKEGLQAGKCFVKGRPIMLAVLDLSFFMGTLSSVVGEKLTRTIEHATDCELPLVIVSGSGGARMQESALSLMQMAKTSAALARFDDAGGLFISVLTDPTTGGVTASFAMLGDIILAEPNALIGFAGPRVIKQTIRRDLPEGFQRAEFLLERGFVDRVVPRADLRKEIARLIDYAGK